MGFADGNNFDCLDFEVEQLSSALVATGFFLKSKVSARVNLQMLQDGLPSCLHAAAVLVCSSLQL